MIRVLLKIIIFFFIILISVEEAIILLYSVCKKKCKKFNHSLLKKIRIVKKKLHPFHFLSKRKTKKTVIFISPLRIKIKYFFYGIFFSFLFLFFPIVFLIFLQDLPSPKELSFRQIPQTTKIYDRNDILLAEIYTTQDRTLIPLADVPDCLQKATLAIEDKNFYKHPGFDLPSIMRAFQKNISGNSIQGGSTITQQLIKSSILTPEQSISRKIKEVTLAFWAERIYTKKQILEMYFNQVPYGGMAWGAEAASEIYFSKPVKELDLAESAFLAGLTAAPSLYSPYGSNPDIWKKRQKEVLNRMVALQYITKKQADTAAKEPLYFKKQMSALHAPHFVEYVKELLISKYGLATVEKGGLQVRTTLDLKKQNMAEKIVKEEVDANAALNLTNGAAVITDPRNGDILAMIGSKDFYDPNGGNVNIATSLRQPGSSIKVVTYAAALSHGYTAASMLDDSPVSYPSDSEPYSPVNYDGRFHGRVSLRIALANSLNIPAVKTLNQIGIPVMVNLGKQMGITHWGNPSEYGLSLTLGSGEVTMLDMASVYGTLANKGTYEEINPVLKITDTKGNLLEQKTQSKGLQILDEGVTFILADILADNAARSMEFGSNSPLFIPNHTVSVKTGTTDNKRDNWTDGYTNNFVVIVWVGNNDNSPMSQNLASGITGAAPIWHKIMENLLAQKPETKPILPSQVVQRICFGKPEYLLKGTESTNDCRLNVSPTAAYLVR
jgi:1A family penicillin-binding protein